MAASLICVDISSESEDECPPDAKRRRLEKPRNGSAKQSLPEKLMNVPKASVAAGGRLGALTAATAARAASNPPELQPLKPMHIPSGITITKHGKNAAAASSNGMVITSIASMHEFNNNNNILNNNNNNSSNSNSNTNKNKTQKTPMAQKVGYPPNNKAHGQSIMITSVSSPNHQVKPTLPTLPVKLAPGQQVKLTPAQQVKLSPVQQVKMTPVQQVKMTPMTMPNHLPKPAFGYQVKATPTTTANQSKPTPTTTANQAKPTPNFQVQQTSVYRMKGTPLPSGYQMMAMPSNQPKLTPTNQLKPMPSNQITVSAVAPKLVSPQQPQKQLPLAAVPPKNQVNAASAGLPEKTTARQSVAQQKMSAGQINQQQQQQKKQLMAQQLQQAVLSGPQYQTQRVATIQQQQKQQLPSPPGQKAPPQLTPKPLPTLQRAPVRAAAPQMQIQPKQQQQPQQMQRAPPPAHLVQKQTPPPLQLISTHPPPAHSPAAKINPPAVRSPSVLQITPVPRAHAGLTMKQLPSPGSSAARTLPYMSHGNKSGTPPLTSHLQSFTASATPPQRLLATPPHCSAALNEPLLVNLPPTTSITPQLTPTTTPPPPATALQHQQVAKTSAFKLNSLPGASISPVPAKPANNNIKRIQPITVLKKSDEDWRRHLAQQHLQNQQLLQMQQRQRDQQLPPPPTIVLVESPPTTPPTDKQETADTQKPPIQTTPAAQRKPNRSKPAEAAARVNSPTITPTKQVKKTNLLPEIVVNLDDLPETPPAKQPPAKQLPSKQPPTKQPAEKKPSPPPEKPAAKSAEREPFVPEYAALLQLCAEADKSKEMAKLIETKLTKYYYSVHESFVKSRGFRKLLESAMERIKAEPDMVYMHLSGVVEELKARRKAKVVIAPEPEAEAVPEKAAVKEVAPNNPSKRATPESKPEREQEAKDDGAEPISPGIDKRTDAHIRKMNIALHRINKRIQALENAEVDWDDDDNSSYLTVERYKKRACEIYEKICDLTGESKSAFRQLKQPIRFEDSPYPQFNRMLSSFVNRMQEFPDYHDVLQLLEHCNKMHDMGLAFFEMKRIASDAFLSVGRLLQSKRKRDLYETANHFTGSVKDPAATDPELMAKLRENTKKHTKISDVLAKYCREQDLNSDNMREARLKKQKEAAAAAAVIAEDDDKPCTSAQAAAKAAAAALLNGTAACPTDAATGRAASDDKDDAAEDDDDDEEEEEESESEEEDLDEFVDKFKTNGDLSDADSEIEAETLTDTTPKTDALLASKDVIDITRDETADSVERANTKSNIKPNDAPPNGKLKIISVSSLNASVVSEKSQPQAQALAQAEKQSKQSSNALPKRVIAAEIIISDEES